MKEKWRDVFGWEGLYEVSNLGRVRSLYFKGHPRKTPYILKPGPSRTGYLRVFLCTEAEATTYQVSRLVLEAFLGAPPAGHQACHNDGVRTNNHLSNLRWDTPFNNSADKKIHGTVCHGEKRYNSKLTDHDVAIMKARVARGEEASKVARQMAPVLGCAWRTIWKALRGQSWNHVKPNKKRKANG